MDFRLLTVGLCVGALRLHIGFHHAPDVFFQLVADLQLGFARFHSVPGVITVRKPNFERIVRIQRHFKLCFLAHFHAILVKRGGIASIQSIIAGLFRDIICLCFNRLRRCRHGAISCVLSEADILTIGGFLADLNLHSYRRGQRNAAALCGHDRQLRTIAVRHARPNRQNVVLERGALRGTARDRKAVLVHGVD